MLQHGGRGVHDVMKGKKKKAPHERRTIGTLSEEIPSAPPPKSRDWPLICAGFSPNRAGALLLIRSASLHYSHQWRPQSVMGTHCRKQPETPLNSAAQLALHSNSRAGDYYVVSAAFFTCHHFSACLLSREQRGHRGGFLGLGHSGSLLGPVRPRIPFFSGLTIMSYKRVKNGKMTESVVNILKE